MFIVSRFRESLTLVLMALLPLHAMAVTVLTHAFQGSGHAPLQLIAVWKEVVLAVIILSTLVEIMLARDAGAERRTWSLDLLDWCIVLAIVTGALVSVTSSDFSSVFSAHLSLADRKFLIGFKYDFLPLVTFFLLRRVIWSGDFQRSASWVVIVIGFLIAAFGIVTLFVPMAFFSALGYSDLHSLYRPHAPIAAFQMVEGTTLRRMQSVMSGPNQFGLWVLIPFAASLQWCATALQRRTFVRAVLALAVLALFSITIGLTYSRSAWMGAGVLTVFFILWMFRGVLRSALHRSAVLIVAGALAGVLLLGGIHYAPQIVLRTQSLRGHLEKPAKAVDLMRAYPLGLGLASAGPASNHFSDTCVFFDLGSDISWAKKRTDICVFLGGVRKLPPGKVCECPLLTENWYLQWGVEMGVVGFLLCILIVVLPLFAVRRISPFSARAFPLLALVGIATGGLFLHAFEDSGVAYTLWILLAAAGLTVPDADYVKATDSSGTLRA
jgi:hypothetical protein